MEPVISELTMVDYEEVLALWKSTAGIGLSGADERCPMERFLSQNQGLSFTARLDGRIVSTVLCGSDGRGGCPYPLAVDDQFRHRGIGRTLVDRFPVALRKRGIQKCPLMVFANNLDGQAFWRQTGWIHRPEIVLMSKDTSDQGESGFCPC
jgi:GNAT superfamily N-acetyltransferase